MRLVRLILSVFIAVGLVLAPAQAGLAMRMAPMAAMANMDNTDDAVVAVQGKPHTCCDCPCCPTSTTCSMVVCAGQCVQLGPAPEFVLQSGGRASLSSIMPITCDGLRWQPPIPPPRA